jgi:hypothetical protein
MNTWKYICWVENEISGLPKCQIKDPQDMENCVLFAKKKKVEAVKYIFWKISSFIHHYLPKGKDFLKSLMPLDVGPIYYPTRIGTPTSEHSW